MYATYIVKRTQIYIDEGQDRLLGERAQAVGETKSSLIREALTQYLTPADGEDAHLARFRAALDEVAAQPAELPPGQEYVADLRARDVARERAQDKRRA